MTDQDNKKDSEELTHKDSLSLRSLGRDALRWCTRHAVGNWFVLGAFVCGIGAAIAAQFEPNPNAVAIKGMLATIAIILQSIGWGFGLGAKKQCTALRTENMKLRERLQRVACFEKNLDAIFGVWLKYVINELKLGNDSRASFYLWDDHGRAGSEFLFIARESTNPALRKQGRERFPGDQGVISDAWHSDDGVASYFASKNVKTDDDVMKDMIKTYHFSEDEAKRLTMKARVILGHVIRHNQSNVGIVIVESMRKVNEKTKRTAYVRACSDLITKITPCIGRLFEMYSNAVFKQEETEEEA